MNRSAALFLIQVVLFGQSAASPTFDAASVKRTNSPGSATDGLTTSRRPAGGRRSGGPGTDDPGRIHYPHMILKRLLSDAYEVSRFQIRGPGWLDEEEFDIDATMSPQTTKAEFNLMLQNLVAERFKMSIHREAVEISGYAIVLDKIGPRLRQSVETAPPQHYDAPERRADAMDRFGLPTVSPNAIEGRPEMTYWNGVGGTRLYAEQQTIRALATELRNRLQQPVTDATGLSAKYDFILTFAPIGRTPPPSDTEVPPDVFAAVQSQLGLRLESRKLSVEVIVIDRINKVPTSN
jgi:uncharacterized protein (TIGR03435 family)